MALNFQHLRYFWITAREGSLTAAAARLRLAPSTVSAQIKALEEEIGQALFERRGRGLVLTERGRMVCAYADDIFALGEELLDTVRSATGARHAFRMRVGVANNLPKFVAHRLLAPALRVPDFPVHLICLQDRADALVADLAVHNLDLVLADTPVGLASEVAVRNQLLGTTGITVMGTPELLASLTGPFPQSMNGAPVLLPDPASAMRRQVEEWCRRLDVWPRVVAEFEDSALLKVFGQAGAGLFPVPSLAAAQVEARYGVRAAGELDGVEERLFALFAPGRGSNPAVAAVLAGAADVLGDSSV